jgi:hypothetical protein
MDMKHIRTQVQRADSLHHVLTTRSQPIPTTLLPVHMNMDPLILPQHYYNQYKKADV